MLYRSSGTVTFSSYKTYNSNLKKAQHNYTVYWERSQRCIEIRWWKLVSESSLNREKKLCIEGIPLLGQYSPQILLPFPRLQYNMRLHIWTLDTNRMNRHKDYAFIIFMKKQSIISLLEKKVTKDSLKPFYNIKKDTLFKKWIKYMVSKNGLNKKQSKS